MNDEQDKCGWCGRELSPVNESGYCEGTDCEYDGEKWRRLHYEQ